MALALSQLLPYERRQASDQTPLFNRAAVLSHVPGADRLYEPQTNFVIRK